MAVREKMLHEFGMKVSSVRNLRPSLSVYSLELSRVHPSLPPLLMSLIVTVTAIISIIIVIVFSPGEREGSGDSAVTGDEGPGEDSQD